MVGSIIKDTFTHMSFCPFLPLSVKDCTQDLTGSLSCFGFSTLGYLLRVSELVIVMLVCGIFIRVLCNSLHCDFLFDVFLMVGLSLGYTETKYPIYHIKDI